MKGYSSRYNREESYNQSQYSSSLFVPENIGASMRQFDSIKHHNPILDTFYASGLGNGSLNRNRGIFRKSFINLIKTHFRGESICTKENSFIC